MKALGAATILVLSSAAAAAVFTGAGSPEASMCLADDRIIEVLDGPMGKVRVEVDSNETVDARNAQVEIRERDLIPVPERRVNENNGIRILDRGHDGGCWTGGTVVGDFDWCASWRALKELDHAAISIGNTGLKVERLHVRNVEDAIRVHDGADLILPSSPPDTKFFPANGFEISSVWAEYVRDDCIENDAYAGGVIRDSLLDGCNTGISQTPGMRLRRLAPEHRADARRLRDEIDGTGRTVILDRVLLRMQPFPHPNRPDRQWVQKDGIVYGGGELFKIRDRSPRFAIRDSIFAFDGRTKGSFSFPELADCANNTIVWLGEGDFPGHYPESCFEVTTDVGVWRRAVRDWHARHPEVGAAYKPAPDAMGDTSLVECHE